MKKSLNAIFQIPILPIQKNIESTDEICSKFAINDSISFQIIP